MKFKAIAYILALALLSAAAYGADDDKEKKREKSRKMAAEALQDLYKLEPTSQAAIQKAAGYAVFDNMGVNVFAVEHGTRFRTGRQQQDQARNLHEDGFGRCRSGHGSERLCRGVRLRER